MSSDGQAAIHQSTRIGLFQLYGEHAGLPVYWKRATKEYLFYTKTPSGFQWLVGPDFQKPHAGIKVYGRDNCNRGPKLFSLCLNSKSMREKREGGKGQNIVVRKHPGHIYYR